MPEPSHIARARAIEQLASDLHALAFDFQEPAKNITVADRRIAEAERIASAIRGVVRGSGT